MNAPPQGSPHRRPPTRLGGLFAALLGLPLMLGIGCATPADAPPEVDKDGLARVAGSPLAEAYLAPGADLSVYKRVMLLDCFVAFRKHWQASAVSQGRQVTPADMDRIKASLATEFAKAFKAELIDGGYEVVDEPAEDVLLVRPAIVDLNINAPGTLEAVDETTFAASAGSMTLYAEFYDAYTSALIARVTDRRAAIQDRSIMWQNGVTNKAAAEEILRHWAKILRERLDAAHASAAPGGS